MATSENIPNCTLSPQIPESGAWSTEAIIGLLQLVAMVSAPLITYLIRQYSPPTREYHSNRFRSRGDNGIVPAGGLLCRIADLHHTTKNGLNLLWAGESGLDWLVQNQSHY